MGSVGLGLVFKAGVKLIKVALAIVEVEPKISPQKYSENVFLYDILHIRKEKYRVFTIYIAHNQFGICRLCLSTQILANHSKCLRACNRSSLKYETTCGL